MANQKAGAVVVTAPDQLEIRQVSRPHPGPYEAEVQILACGICSGTDTHIVSAQFPFMQPYPFVLGHESIGRVTATGDKVRSFKIADLVLRPCLVRPGETLDGLNAVFGGMATHGLVFDARAMQDDTPRGEEPRLPAFAQAQQLVPPDFDPHHAGMFITFKETLGALHDFITKPGASVLILGSGVVGLSFTRSARLIGCSNVVTLGRRPEPLEMALELGASDVINTAEDDAVERSNELTGGEGFDYIVEAVGDQSLLNVGLKSVAAGGAIGIYGVPAKMLYTLDWAGTRGRWSLKHLATREPEEHEAALAYWRLGLAGLERLVTDRLPWGQVEEALELVRNRKAYKVSLDLTA